MRQLLQNTKRRYSIPLRPLACAVLIIVGGLLTCWAYIQVQGRVQVQTTKTFDEITQTHVQQLSQQIDTSGDLLYATRGLFAVTNVSSSSWKSFVKTQNIMNRYPGMKAIGYAEMVTEKDVPAFLKQLQLESSNPNITIHPKTTAGNNVILRYHQDGASSAIAQAQALGFVLTSNAERSKALKQAEQSGRITAVAPVLLATNSQPGFLLILPLMDRPSVEEGSRSVYGYSIAAFEIGPMVDKTIGERLKKQGTALTITDISEGESVLYNSSGGSDFRSLTRDVVIQVADRQWQLTFKTPSRNLAVPAQRYAPLVILGGGAILIITACVLVYAIRLRKKLSNVVIS